MNAFGELLLVEFADVVRTEDIILEVQLRHQDVCWAGCLDWEPEPRHKTVACSVAFEQRCMPLPDMRAEGSFELGRKLVVVQGSVVDLVDQLVPEEIDMMHGGGEVVAVVQSK